MLTSLRAQSRQPEQVVVVDGSEKPVEDVVASFGDMAVEYVRCIPPSLARQRNAGMAKLGPQISVAGYLDDDVVLEPDAIERMHAFWEAAPSDIGGAAFNIVNNPVPKVMFLKQLFGIDSRKPGRVLASGFPSSIPPQTAQIETDWLFGGATLWRRHVINEFAYDEWFIGTGFMEDVEYSFNVRGRYRLVLVAEARLVHRSHPVRPDRQYLLGWWQVVNRMYFVSKYRHRGMSIARAWWATVGLIVLNTLAAIWRRSPQHWNRARGNVAGLYALLTGRRAQIGGHLK
jgi:glycosyltransferase involved in cell wall biosynthesis